MKRVNLPQRAVVVAALGFILWAFGTWVNSGATIGTFGWTGYAPLTDSPAVGLGSRFGLNDNGHLAVWIGLTLIWMVSALIILRTPKSGPPAAMNAEDPRQSDDAEPGDPSQAG